MSKNKLKDKSDIAEINEKARKVGLSYGTYVGYVETGYLDHYIKNRFHEACVRNADEVTVENSNIVGAYYGDTRE